MSDTSQQEANCLHAPAPCLDALNEVPLARKNLPCPYRNEVLCLATEMTRPSL